MIVTLVRPNSACSPEQVAKEGTRNREWVKLILQQETSWIERLAATYPPGLNETQSYKPFL